MTTYTNIPDNEVDQDSPVTQPLVTALRDNPLAIAEGAVDAPKVENKALAGTFIGEISTSSSVWAGLNDLGGIRGVFLSGRTQNTTGGSVFIRFSTDNGSTWSSSYILYDDVSGFDFYGWHIDLVTGDYFGINDFNSVSGTATLPAGTVNAFQIRSQNNMAWLSFATKGKST